VLEREHAGFGASGRNAGHVTPTLGKDLPTLLAVYGRQRAGRLAHAAEAAIVYLEQRIERHGIDCDYHAGGNVLAGVHDSQRPRLERAARAAQDLGLPARFLTTEEMRSRGIPESFRCGVLEETGGVLHPGRLVLGLRRAALEAGAALYEHTPLLALEEAPRPLLRTPEGRLRADRVVFATNAYTRDTGMLGRRATRLHVTLFQTQRLSEAQRGRLGWQGREGIYTAHEILESYRLTADDRIVGGSKRVRYGWGGGALPEDDPPTQATLERAFRERFPGLDVGIERFWTGPIGMMLDFLPAIGCTGRFGNLFYAVGYNGHGVALATWAGRALADWITGREGPWRALVERRSFSLPPEPLAWLVTRGLLAGLGALDRRLDRRVRDERG
jgi:glycine/D-amino acid oxidase-like deaminating enzyme